MPVDTELSERACGTISKDTRGWCVATKIADGVCAVQSYSGIAEAAALFSHRGELAKFRESI
jgi:hypothetical protein